jgi:hypothetical protein
MWYASLRLRHTTTAAAVAHSRSIWTSSSWTAPVAVRLYTLQGMC